MASVIDNLTSSESAQEEKPILSFTTILIANTEDPVIIVQNFINTWQPSTASSPVAS